MSTTPVMSDPGNGVQVPASQVQTPPNAMEQDNTGKGPTTAPVGDTQQDVSTSTVPQQPVPQDALVTPQGVRKPSVLERAYHGILSALGGSDDVQLHRDPTTGTMIATKVAKTPGAQWKQIIGGALTGIAGASQVGNGPGQKTRALGAGIAAGQNMAEKQQQQKVDAANQDYDEQQKLIVRKAQLQKMAVETSTAAFAAERMKIDAAAFDAKALNDHMKWIQDNGGTDLGTFQNFADIAAHAKDNPTLAADIAHGRIAVVPHIVTTTDADGVQHQTVAGVQAASVPEKWGEDLNDKPLPISRMVPGKDGKPPTYTTEMIPAGTIKNKDYNAAVLAQVTEQTSYEGKIAENKYKTEQVALAKSEESEHYSAAAKNKAEATALSTASDGATINDNAKQLVEGTIGPEQSIEAREDLQRNAGRSECVFDVD